mmetsp:Transcript_31993/g.68790  ORF Transcript_31993/g.68790 Transcript_31993/m.68790 type:complete len:110 (-) Transcript_31993:295-624(-)|eukprot:CAMPEP_0183344050 /NCGR_PEP_ID=MMETSP0164_2-20130417/9832_1 /TAXON_ID=221442 /ORGANISM="Coccolithus pelagicus ssp braarudi, Strain PLY182g" /LENGTH=109 /DNA_ID=CAMNT_0025514995 /DNA_START=21 /DNA_END=350 /DNA_ORIENTATION=-
METLKTANPQDVGYLRTKDQQTVTAKPLSQKDVDFLQRMDGDVDSRRQSKFINELKKHPAFKPSMLAPPKPPFKEVSLTDGPIVKSHNKKQTGLETKRPYQWGPLGGFY